MALINTIPVLCRVAKGSVENVPKSIWRKGSAPTRWGAYSAPQTLWLDLGSEGRQGKGLRTGGRGVDGREGKGEEGRDSIPELLFPLQALHGSEN